jgi:hypothetical protein
VRVVREIAGLHATASTTPYLSLFARLNDFRKDQLDDALYITRSVARVRCVRKTIYIHAIGDVPAFHRATSQPLIRASRRYAEGRGVSQSRYQELAGDILRLLEKRELTAAEIRSALSTEAELSAVLYLMCDEGRLVRGKPVRGWRDRTQRYARFADWFPGVDLDALSEPEAITQAVRSYLAAFGPATEEDAAWWTGLGKRKVRRALTSLRDELVEASAQGVRAPLMLLQCDLASLSGSEPRTDPPVRLLPVLDPLLMGHRDRGRFLDQARRPWVFDRSGNATSTILIDGRVAGVWDFEQTHGAHEAALKLFFFDGVGQAVRDRVFQEGESVGHFIAGRHVPIEECQTMTPLTQRTAGSMMSPLKGS